MHMISVTLKIQFCMNIDVILVLELNNFFLIVPFTHQYMYFLRLK
jgi:hypothetical protein